MASFATYVAKSTLVLLSVALISCEKHTKTEQYILDQATDLVQRHDRSGEKTFIEAASLYKDRKSICGYATIGARKHVPYIIKYSKALPDGGFATVDLVMTKPPYKGAPVESQDQQSSRILSSCREIGHVLPSY